MSITAEAPFKDMVETDSEHTRTDEECKPDDIGCHKHKL